MKYLVNSLIMTFLPLVFLFCQNNFYWKAAPVKGTKIYSIKFFDPSNGVAISDYVETLFTSDSGKHWSTISRAEQSENSKNDLWDVEIYCSIMKTDDGGITWEPYLQEPQEHFCMTYFKDENTGVKVAEEFLSKVVNIINEYWNKGEVDSLLNAPVQCTEYFTNAHSGWALGWCVRSFKKPIQM